MLNCAWHTTNKNSRIYLILTVASKFTRFESISITACGKYCKRRCTKHASLICTNRNGKWEQNGPSCHCAAIRQWHRQWVQINDGV